MSSGSSNNLNGDVEPNKAKHDANNEESSHLLEASESGAKYGSRQAVKIVKANATESANASPQVKQKTETIYQSLLTGAGTKPISIFKFLSPSCANLSTTDCPMFDLGKADKKKKQKKKFKLPWRTQLALCEMNLYLPICFVETNNLQCLFSKLFMYLDKLAKNPNTDTIRDLLAR